MGVPPITDEMVRVCSVLSKPPGTVTLPELLKKKGFCFIEVLSPCPTLYQRRNRLGTGQETMQFYKQKSVIKNGASTKDLDLSFQGEIVVGEFVNIERPTLRQAMDLQLQRTLGDRSAARK